MLTGAALTADIESCAVGPGQCAFWFLGQHGFAVKLGSTILYIDAFLSPHSGRQVPPLLQPADIRHATAFLGSHDHADHIDRPAWPALAVASPQAVFVVPELLRARLAGELKLPAERFRGVDLDRPVRVGDVQVAALPAAHELLALDPATGLHPCVGFVVQAAGFTLYHAGDTCIYEGLPALLRRFRPDLAFLPINGRDARRLAAGCIGNMTYQEAVDLAGAVGPGLVVPTHFDMFVGNCENPALFVDYLRVKYPGQRCAVPQHGTGVLVTAQR